VLLPGNEQGIDDAVMAKERPAQHSELGIKECDIESGIVEDEGGVTQKLKETINNFRKGRHGTQEVFAQAMNGECFGRHVALRIDVLVKMPAGWDMVHHFDGANLNNAVSESGIKPSGFGIEYNFAHGISPLDVQALN
jgi:hypothetical protein